jgi:hypothetical protein
MKFHINTPQTCPRCGGSSGTQSIQLTEICHSVPVEELPPARVPGLGPGSGGLSSACFFFFLKWLCSLCKSLKLNSVKFVDSYHTRRVRYR